MEQIREYTPAERTLIVRLKRIEDKARKLHRRIWERSDRDELMGAPYTHKYWRLSALIDRVAQTKENIRDQIIKDF